VSVLGDLRLVAAHEDFRRLFAVRIVSQTGDGMFQVGLATLFFFSPENRTTAAGVATAFAVLLLPFTVVGPFAGVLLDRWRRRQVLLFGNLTRVGLTVVIALLLTGPGVGPAVYVLTLLTLSINRFLLSALSAGLPHVVPRDQLLMANTVSPTLGAAAAGVGGALGLGIGRLAPAGDGHDGVVLLGAATLFGAASALALRLGRDQLGPDVLVERGELWDKVLDVGRGLVHGARYLVRERTPALALGAMAAHRFLFGATFIASILISRNLLSDPSDADAGLATFATVLAASAAGFALAAVATPVVHERLSPAAWIVTCLVLAAGSQLVLAAGVTRTTMLAAALVLGLAAQGAKIAVDTIVQGDTHDRYRGRAFALYDVLYNAAFVGAAALSAVALPDSGYSAAVFAVVAAAYLATAAGFRAGMLRARAVRLARGEADSVGMAAARRPPAPA
jgi:MFS family permease